MLRFKRVGKDEVRVYAGRKRVGTIRPGRKFIRAEVAEHMEAMRGYLLGFQAAKTA